MKCENCGLPPGALIEAGQSVEIVRRAENKFKRDTKTTVWACSEECAAQLWGISKYGPSTHKWDLTLNQIRSQYRRRNDGNDKGTKPHTNRKLDTNIFRGKVPSHKSRPR